MANTKTKVQDTVIESTEHEENNVLLTPADVPQDQVDQTVANLIPWSTFPEPEVFSSEIHNIHVVPQTDSPDLTFYRVDNGEAIGVAERNALRELSTRIGFPVDFLSKVSPELQAEIINERIERTNKLNFSFIKAEDRILNIAPGWREVNPHRHVAQTVFDEVVRLTGKEPEIAKATLTNGKFSLRLVTDRMEPVTKQVGDILQMGIELNHAYGFELGVSLFVNRLICTNGMCSNLNVYSWNQKEMGTASAQMDWVLEGVETVFNGFGSLVSHAKDMAETPVNGDPLTVLLQRARMLKIPTRMDGLLMECFTDEPGNTEWHILNALTRFATHKAHPRLARRLQNDAGLMVQDFEVVDAKLPRSLAVKVGAKIIVPDTSETSGTLEDTLADEAMDAFVNA